MAYSQDSHYRLIDEIAKVASPQFLIADSIQPRTKLSPYAIPTFSRTDMPDVAIIPAHDWVNLSICVDLGIPSLIIRNAILSQVQKHHQTASYANRLGRKALPEDIKAVQESYARHASSTNFTLPHGTEPQHNDPESSTVQHKISKTWRQSIKNLRSNMFEDFDHMVYDCPDDDEEKAKWAAYRQETLDIPGKMKTINNVLSTFDNSELVNEDRAVVIATCKRALQFVRRMLAEIMSGGCR